MAGDVGDGSLRDDFSLLRLCHGALYVVLLLLPHDDRRRPNVGDDGPRWADVGDDGP